MQDSHDLSVIIAAQVPLITIETHDEKGAIELLRRVARAQDKSLYRWSVTDGLQTARFGLQLEAPSQYAEAADVLTHIKERAESGIYALCDLHPWLSDQPKNIRLLKDIVLKNEHGPVTLVLISHKLELPGELARFSAHFQLSLPTESEILALIKEEAGKWSIRNRGKKVRAGNSALVQLATTLKGLSHGEVRRLARTAIYDDGAITGSDLPEINKAKFRLMDMDGVLSFTYEIEDMASVGGMKNLKQWLELRRQAFYAEKKVTDMPRGILLLGVQGGGKSLAAKAVAGSWKLPMLRLDMGALYNKYYGETERNLRDALALADRMSPCVLWVDEIEKGVGGGDGSDSGLSQRVMGTLLTWMQERKKAVFLVATANDISRLPPELMRRGRFDEIFFVDLPDKKTRKSIFAIHLARREFNPSDFDLDLLAGSSEGFSGAEIEQAIVSSCYTTMPSGENLTTESLMAELVNIAPLSVVMSEKLDWLRNWARERNLRSI